MEQPGHVCWFSCYRNCGVFVDNSGSFHCFSRSEHNSFRSFFGIITLEDIGDVLFFLVLLLVIAKKEVSKKEVQQIVVKTVLWYDRNGNQLLVTNFWKENDDYWVVSWWWIDWFISWLITCWLVLKENVGRVKSWCFSIISIICYNLDLSNSLYRNNFRLLM